MITVRDVIEAMERWAPSSLAESWDNVGLLTGAPGDPVRNILIALDVTDESLCAARDSGASLVISHHPPIFRPLSSLSGTSLPVRVLREAIRADIALFAAHTNLDQAPGGVSHAAARLLGVETTTPLVPAKSGMVKFVTFAPPSHVDSIREAAGNAGAGRIGGYGFCSFAARGTGTFLPDESARPFTGEPGRLSREIEDRIEMIVPAALVERVVEAVRKAHPYEEMAYDVIPLTNGRSVFGYGALGVLPSPMDSAEFVSLVARALGIDALAVTGNDGREIRRIAVMGGSGGSFIPDAVAAGADAYVTGDIGYHDFLAAGDSILLVDASHRATELPVLDAIERTLADIFADEVTCIVHRGSTVPERFHSPISGTHHI
jgi:dinuclear metal center YbgI/SA1388 family protein